MQRTIIIGTRGSKLALWQANHIKDELEAVGVHSEIRIIKTQGDNFVNLTFSKLLGKGFFTKELEEELLAGTIDLAVHSHKDLPTEQPPGLVISAVSEREEPCEVLLIHPEAVDISRQFSLRDRAIVGSSSARRRSQLLSYRPDLELADIRGNVPSRVQKLRDREFDAILLAKAGLKRLGIDLSGLHVEELDPQVIVPAASQGVLALQIREADTDLAATLQKIHHPEVQDTIRIEREILHLFEGGCRMPIGAYCVKENDEYLVWVSRAANDDEYPVRYHTRAYDTTGLARRIVDKYLKKDKAIKSVFITRDLSEDSYFYRSLTRQGIEVTGSSMIRTFPIITTFSSSILKRVDWIFFASRNAIDYFFKLNPLIPKKTKIAVMGRGSASQLREHGRQPDFVGTASDTPGVAQQFSQVAAGQTVLFPAAKDSLRGIQRRLGSDIKIIDLPIYETAAKENADASGADVLVFTSPSNVEAYLGPYLIDAHQKVIAIGKSTGQKLEEYGITDYLMPYAPDEVGLAEKVFELT